MPPYLLASSGLGAKGFYFDAFQVDGPRGKRGHAALELLGEGRGIVYQDMGLSLSEPGLLVVEVPSWVDVADMPEAIVKSRLAKAEAIVDDLQQTDADFAGLISGRQTEVRLVDESYGWVYAARRNGVLSFTEAWSRSRRPRTP